MIWPSLLVACQVALVSSTLQSGIYSLQNVNSGKYLHESGADVRVSDDFAGPGGQWRVEAVGDGVYTLQSVGSAKYLSLMTGTAGKGKDVRVLDNPGSDSAEWRLSEVPRGDGTAYVLRSEHHGALALGVDGKSTESGASVRVWDNPGETSSHWELVSDDTCHDAVIGDICYNDVIWAKEFAINAKPEWYPGLTSSSSFADFQAHLHFCYWTRCARPCAATALHSCGIVERIWNDASCLDAPAGSRCLAEIEEAQQHGIHAHPDWYPTLSEQSNVREFQFRLFQGQQTGLEDHGCAEPCCHDTVPGESCHEEAVWAMMHGINDPQFNHVYPPSLTNTSAFEEFQAYLHLCYPERCPEPCADTVVQANHQGGALTLDCPDAPSLIV